TRTQEQERLARVPAELQRRGQPDTVPLVPFLLQFVVPGRRERDQPGRGPPVPDGTDQFPVGQERRVIRARGRADGRRGRREGFGRRVPLRGKGWFPGEEFQV